MANTEEQQLLSGPQIRKTYINLFSDDVLFDAVETLSQSDVYPYCKRSITISSLFLLAF